MFCSDGEEAGSDAERRRAARQKKRTERAAEKASKAKKKSSSSGGGGSKKTKKVKVKLPGQPKRGMSAYFLWMNENREKIKKEHPGLSVTEFGKKAGELWKELEDKSV